MMFYLGIDAGGTKCRARLVDPHGNVRGEAAAGAANIRFGVSNAAHAIEEACQGAVRDAGGKDIPFSTISAAIGIAGISKTEALDALRKHPFFAAFHRATFVSDAVIANFGAHAGHDGGTVIIGTGSIGIAKIGEKTIKIGGYGFPISDLGSGAYIGLSALKQALRAIDDLIASSDMTEEILSLFDHNTSTIVASLDSMSATNYAKFAPIVVSYAQKGDPVADQIMQKSARHAEEMIYAIHKLGAPRLSITGGLGPIIMSWLDPSVKALLSEPLGDPLQGAIALAKNIQTISDASTYPETL